MTQLETFTGFTTTEVKRAFNDWVQECSPQIIEIKVTSEANTYTLWVTYQA
ncbi:hypothetical protein [Lactobacillus gasseri]|uniref:hypothetical protein n=1 Tax=Lactobacillus gasseri TaxID=1596 RepID=UPI0012D349B0|nr:hypothetical protein [Lactobacillus gasseri]MCT7749887.1 hypothetical protein [Lactobacillus gasseri]MCZ3948648.1 hypothetical protein [Lactobacillus gasseri]QTH66839.1 hypothetical protein J3E66_001480 [Lactobacillus gasseri]